MCDGENILCKISHNIIIEKIKEENAMEAIVETELHGLRVLKRLFRGCMKWLEDL